MREATKARRLANNAFAEDERRRLLDVATSLEREARAVQGAIGATVAGSQPTGREALKSTPGSGITPSPPTIRF